MTPDKVILVFFLWIMYNVHFAVAHLLEIMAYGVK